MTLELYDFNQESAQQLLEKKSNQGHLFFTDAKAQGSIRSILKTVEASKVNVGDTLFTGRDTVDVLLNSFPGFSRNLQVRDDTVLFQIAPKTQPALSFDSVAIFQSCR